MTKIRFPKQGQQGCPKQNWLSARMNPPIIGRLL